MDDFPFKIETPLGPRLPIVRALGIRGSEKVRHRFRQGLDGAWEHWLDFGKALDACGLTPRELQNVRNRIAEEERQRRQQEREDAEPLPVDLVAKVLMRIPKDPELREAVEFMLRQGCA